MLKYPQQPYFFLFYFFFPLMCCSKIGEETKTKNGLPESSPGWCEKRL